VTEPGRADADLRSPIAAFRAILIGVCAVLASLPDGQHRALLTLAGLGVLTWVVYHAPLSDERRTQVAYAEAVLAGIAIVASGGDTSPLLPYLLCPGLALGLLAGPRAVLQGAALAAAALAVSRAVARPPHSLEKFAVASVQWVLLSLAVGLVATWARRLVYVEQPAVDRYGEVRSLLEQLRTATRGLPSGLDATAAAAGLLEEANRLMPHTRSAVLVQSGGGGALIPIAVRGTRRVPWRAPLSSPGPLRDAWLMQQPTIDRRKPDRHGRRHGSTLAALPLVGHDAPFGLLVLEGKGADAFPAEQVDGVRRAAAESGLRMETSLLFEEVRSNVTTEERGRLAREMHDGVGQELAFLGYRLDEVRAIAAKTDPDLADRLRELRTDMTALISNLRLSITDLKSSVSHERGLGEALGTYIRAAASGRQLTVHVSLQESPFRLTADREVVLFQIAQFVAQRVRENGRARNLWATLTVDPPSACLVVEHDDDVDVGYGDDLRDLAAVLTQLGGSLVTSSRPGGGVRVEALFEGVSDGDTGAAG
jgi:signal transduction histidine kinase